MHIFLQILQEIKITPIETKTTPIILVVVKDSPNRITERTATIEIAPQVSTGCVTFRGSRCRVRAYNTKAIP